MLAAKEPEIDNRLHPTFRYSYVCTVQQDTARIQRAHTPEPMYFDGFRITVLQLPILTLLASYVYICVFIGVHSITARLTSLALHPVQPPCMRWRDILGTHFSNTPHL